MDKFENIECSGKLVLLFSILAHCESRRDKLLVFSQSLKTLDVIEHFLAKIDKNTRSPNSTGNNFCGFTGRWKKEVDYFRLDGTTDANVRGTYYNSFNDTNNPRARFMQHAIFSFVFTCFNGPILIMRIYSQTFLDFNSCRWLGVEFSGCQ